MARASYRTSRLGGVGGWRLRSAVSQGPHRGLQGSLNSRAGLLAWPPAPVGRGTGSTASRHPWPRFPAGQTRGDAERGWGLVSVLPRPGRRSEVPHTRFSPADWDPDRAEMPAEVRGQRRHRLSSAEAPSCGPGSGGGAPAGRSWLSKMEARVAVSPAPRPSVSEPRGPAPGVPCDRHEVRLSQKRPATLGALGVHLRLSFSLCRNRRPRCCPLLSGEGMRGWKWNRPSSSSNGVLLALWSRAASRHPCVLGFLTRCLVYG